MLHAALFKYETFSVLTVLLGAATTLIVPRTHNENSAIVFQSNPFSSGGALSVQQKGGVTIIKHHDLNGNSVTIIQQK